MESLALPGRAARRRPAAAFEVLQPEIDVGDQLVQTLAQAVDLIRLLLDPAGQGAQLGFELRQPEIEPGGLSLIDPAGAVDLRYRAFRRLFAPVDVELQGAELALQPIDLFD